MRVLFSAVPAFGHLLPVLPLARAARDAGADVVVSTHDALASTVGDLPFVPAGPSLPELIAENARRHEGRGPADLTDLAPIVGMFTGTRIDLTLDSALAVAREHRPDLIVAESSDFVATLVAAALGVPRVAVGISTALPPQLEDLFAEAVQRRLRESGLPDVPRTALVDVWPSWLQPDWYEAPADAVAIRPEAHHDGTGRALTPSFPGREHLPTVLLTLGTVVDDPALLATALAEILRHDVNVLVTVGPGVDPATLDVPRDRVHPTRFVPLAQLLATTSVVVAAGGAGTVLAALTRGVPLVILPVLADQPLIAERVASFGAAVVREDVRELGTGVGLVLGDERHRAAARTAAERLNAVASPAAVWDRLTTLLRA
ncbi:glycosyltransferase [Umezawaea beigongshangensis]|uniref:glycosyltransferase n=1 Tax=Umezawaea beigongshangensis TaxID=2780383 RepID=UPI0018F1159C|nr:glycosyltransferase [Umezawaea beigongshangensis]